MSVVLNVVESDTGKVVKAIDVSGKSERQIDTVELGLIRNMNLEKFHVKRGTKKEVK